MKRHSATIALLCLAALLPPYAMADSYSDYGLILFKHGNYKNAALYFAQSLRANPNNPSALYYSALCCQMLGNAEAARNGFYTVVQVFPKSPEAALAKKALGGSPLPAAAAGQPEHRGANAGSSASPHLEAPLPPLSPSDAEHVVIFREDADTANAKNAVGASLSRIPATLKDAVFDDGCKIVVAPTILDYRPELKSEKPRGYTHGGGYDNCPAMYQPGPNEILVAERWAWNNGPSQPGRIVDYQQALGHEFGHAFDAYMGKLVQTGKPRSFCYLTECSWFYDTYRTEVDNLTNEQRRRAAYFTQPGTGGGSELFAELFASLYSSNPSPRQNMLAAYFPETRKKVAQLASLPSFTSGSLQAALPDLAEKATAASGK